MNTAICFNKDPGIAGVEGLARAAGALDALLRGPSNDFVPGSPPSTSAYKVFQSHRPSVTCGERIARRLEELAARAPSTVEAQLFLDWAAKLRLCVSGVGYRCGLSICPGCARRAAIKRRRYGEDRLHRAIGTIFNLRLSCASDDLIHDSRVMLDCFKTLRKCAWWRAVVTGGSWDMVADPVTDGVRRWNLHFHALVEVAHGAEIPATVLDQTWLELLAEHNRRGSTHLGPWDRKWA